MYKTAGYTAALYRKTKSETLAGEKKLKTTDIYISVA